MPKICSLGRGKAAPVQNSHVTVSRRRQAHSARWFCSILWPQEATSSRGYRVGRLYPVFSFLRGTQNPGREKVQADRPGGGQPTSCILWVDINFVVLTVSERLLAGFLLNQPYSQHQKPQGPQPGRAIGMLEVSSDPNACAPSVLAQPLSNHAHFALWKFPMCPPKPGQPQP